MSSLAAARADDTKTDTASAPRAQPRADGAATGIEAPRGQLSEDLECSARYEAETDMSALWPVWRQFIPEPLVHAHDELRGSTPC